MEIARLRLLDLRKAEAKFPRGDRNRAMLKTQGDEASEILARIERRLMEESL